MARKSLNTSGFTSSQEQSGGFDPLPGGEYLVNIFDVKDGEYKSAANSGVQNINVQFRVAAGRPFANRAVFNLIPMEPTWKNGKDAFSFFQFWGAVLGTGKQFRKDFNDKIEKGEDPADLLLENSDLLGKQVVVKVRPTPRDKAEEAFEKAVAEGRAKEGQTVENYIRDEVREIRPATAEDVNGAAPSLPSETASFVL